LPGERSEKVTKQTASAIAFLYTNMILRDMHPSRNWPARVGEMFEQLCLRDPNLAAVLIADQAFQWPQQSFLALRMPEKEKLAAARKLLEVALLTEDTPTIRTYDERAWGELKDAREAPVAWSLDLFDSLHRRMTLLLRSLGPADFERRFRHPESGDHSLDGWLQLYAWHSAHHTAQIQALRARRGW
jgi:hypothetical protein